MDTPLLAAKRRAFDDPTQANLEALIEAARTPAAGAQAPPDLREVVDEIWRFIWAMDAHARDPFRDAMKRLDQALSLSPVRRLEVQEEKVDTRGSGECCKRGTGSTASDNEVIR